MAVETINGSWKDEIFPAQSFDQLSAKKDRGKKDQTVFVSFLLCWDLRNSLFSCGCDWYFCKFYRKHKNTFENWSHCKHLQKLFETQNPLRFSNRMFIKIATFIAFTQMPITKYQYICTYWKYFLYISRFGIFVNSCIVKNGGGSNIWAH